MYSEWPDWVSQSGSSNWREVKPCSVIMLVKMAILGLPSPYYHARKIMHTIPTIVLVVSQLIN